MLNIKFFSYIHRHSCHHLFIRRLSCAPVCYLRSFPFVVILTYGSLCPPMNYTKLWILDTNILAHSTAVLERYVGCLLFDFIYRLETYLSRQSFKFEAQNDLWIISVHLVHSCICRYRGHVRDYPSLWACESLLCHFIHGIE